MGRSKDSTSKIGLIKELEVGSDVSFNDAKWGSLTVQVSNLKKELEHQDKRFKISYENGNTIVKRVL